MRTMAMPRPRRAIASGSEGTTVLSTCAAEDGERRRVELFLAPVRNEADAVTHYVGASTTSPGARTPRSASTTSPAQIR